MPGVPKKFTHFGPSTSIRYSSFNIVPIEMKLHLRIDTSMNIIIIQFGHHGQQHSTQALPEGLTHLLHMVHEQDVQALIDGSLQHLNLGVVGLAGLGLHMRQKGIVKGVSI